MNLLAPIIAIGLVLAPSQMVSDQLVARLTGAHAEVSTAQIPPYTPVPVPVKVGGAVPPGTAGSMFAIDVATGQTLQATQGDISRPIASVTKMVTALIVVKDMDLNKVVTIPQLPTYLPEDEIVGLKPGEQYTVRDLLAAMLIGSANDAADSLAIIDAGSKDAFASKMNILMAAWRIPSSHFTNPSGLSDKDNYSSASSLATIGNLAIKNATIKQLVNTQTATIKSTEGRTITLKTTDTLLQNGAFQGIKTGYTVAAGQCFVGLTTIQGHQVITVVLGSQDRFGDTQRLVQWINQSYQWQKPH